MLVSLIDVNTVLKLLWVVPNAISLRMLLDPYALSVNKVIMTTILRFKFVTQLIVKNISKEASTHVNSVMTDTKM